jgi:molybdenum cofactor biosynthesis enzyme MoaA
MPKEVFGRDFQFMPSSELLTFEEIARLARIFVANGVEKIRITGGEPLVRRNIERLVEMLAPLDGLRDLTLTTNGSLLSRKAQTLKDAGLRRITVSLDSLDNDVFKAMNDVDFPVESVLEGIEAAREAGLSPIKINMVVKRGVNEHSVLPMARYFKQHGCVLRFIEFMDVGATNGWKMEHVVPSRELVEAINRGLREEMARNPKIVMWGEDIADPKGGVFGVTRGLSTKYPDRVQNSPLAEASIAGVSGGTEHDPVGVELRPFAGGVGAAAWRGLERARREAKR